MDTGLQNQERVPENLKKHLAISVRNIQWSYAIFWSISATQPGLLEWGDGYYNGDIKTRRTVQAAEINMDPLGLQRSEQLRELYESLSAGEAHPQARRPSAALSPEDLTDAEWYYLVCMSFVFNIGQGLPGRTLANGQPSWLSNAHYADTKIFSRSLLAKSASIQTVVCFPFLGGVVELGVTELVLEDLSLIQQIKTSFLENPYTRVSNKSNIPSAGNTTNDRELDMDALDNEILDTKFFPAAGFEELRMASPNNSSNAYEPNQPAEEIYVVEGINEGAAATDQLQSWQFMDDEFSNCVHYSTDSSDCISQTSVEPERAASVPKGEKENDHGLQELQEFNHLKLTAVDLHSDELHYQSVLSSLLKSSHQLILGSHFQNCVQKSSFMRWKKRGMVNFQSTKSGRNPQEVLKKILFEVPRMHDGGLLESPKENVNDGVWRPEADHEVNFNHVLSERRKGEKLNERFLVLKSMIPSISKVDKVSILDDTIEYLKELERKVEELESCSKDLTESGARPRRKLQDTVERTSDNYGNLKTNNNGKKPLINKRKASDIDNTQAEINYVAASKNCSTDNVCISMNNQDVVIEIRCPWREGALLEIMDAVSNLHLDSHSVQSSTNDGVLFLTIKSKFKGPSVPLAGMIKQTLQRVARKC